MKNETLSELHEKLMKSKKQNIMNNSFDDFINTHDDFYLMNNDEYDYETE